MNTSSTVMSGRGFGDSARAVSGHAAIAFSAVVILAMYAAIFAAALLTLSLVEIRQANMVNFNALIATLEQRDSQSNEESGLAAVLHRLRSERRQYDDLIARGPDCISVTGTVLKDEQNNQDGTAMANDRNGSLEAQPNQAKSCDEIQNTIKNHANELRITEDGVMFKRANIEAYYLQYVDGITQKMPQIIPALRLLDSGRPWVNAWARSPFELMEMFLLVSMGMLGGIINVTRWLVDRTASNPSLLDYFYKPAVGGVIALGVFVMFRASQLILGGATQDGAAVVTASIYLLAALGLVSGFCADKAVRQIETLADRLLHSGTSPGGKTPDPIDHQNATAH